MPDGSGTELGRRGKDGEIIHRPGRDLTFSAPKSVSIAALIGGDRRIVEVHDRAVAATLAWVEKNAAETRMKDPETGRMARVGNQKIVAATFRHDTSRNLDPQLHTHAVLANMVQGEDGKWRSMANEGLYARQKLIGMLYRNELAAGLGKLGYGVEKTHADGRFEIAGVPRETIEAFSSRRAEIEAAMEARDLGSPADNPRLAERAALMTRAKKRDIDRDELRGVWQRQAADLGLDAKALVAEAEGKSAAPVRDAAAAAPESPPGRDRDRSSGRESSPDMGSRRRPLRRRSPGRWRISPSARRCSPAPICLAAALAHAPGAVAIGDVEREVAALEKAGTLHAVDLPGAEASLTTDRTVGEERETVALWRGGQGRGRAPMRGWQVQGHLNKGPLTAGQKDAVKLILSAKDRTVGVQGYAGTARPPCSTGRTLAEKKGWRMAGLAPSASAAQTLASEAGIETETLQRFLARNAGVAEGRLTKKGAREMRAAFAKTILVVDEGSLASTVQARDLLRIANALRIPRVVLVGDAKQLDAVDAGKPFAQLQAAGMQTATMDEIMRQRDPALKEAVEASLKGDIERAFEKLGEQRRGGEARQHRRRRRRPLAPARRGRAREHRRHGAEPRTPAGDQRPYPRAPRPRGPPPRADHGERSGWSRRATPTRRSPSPPTTERATWWPSTAPTSGSASRKGDERRVTGVDYGTNEVLLADGRGGSTAWKPDEIGGRRGGSEVYKVEDIELRAGDRIRWTRNDAGLGLVNSRTAEVLRVAERPGDVPPGGRQDAGAGQGRPAIAPSRPRLGVHRPRVPGPHGGQGDRRHGGPAQASHHAEELLCRDQPRPRPGRAGHRRRGRSPRPAPGRHRRAHRGARRHRRDEARGPDKAAEAARTPESRPERGLGEGGGKDREAAKTPTKEPEMPLRDRGKGGMDLGL